MSALNDNQRRSALKSYADDRLNPKMCFANSKTQSNRCLELADIVKKAIDLNKGVSSNRADSVMEDLKFVLIGTGLTSRGAGTHFVGNYSGATGYRSELRDNYNQVQHAMAGIYIGYHYWRPVQWFVLFQEEESQDDKLYNATFPLGRNLTDKNLGSLPDRLRKAIGDNSCWSGK